MMAMNDLRRRALARLALTEDEVAKLYTAGGERAELLGRVATLCESHERLRAELQGAEVLLEDARREVAAVVRIMDELSATWGDEGVFRRCRDRLRALVPDRLGGGEGHV